MELRDKLFTEEQYLKQLAKYTNKISGLENEISQFVNNKVEFDASIYYGRLVDYRVNSIVTKVLYGNRIRMYSTRLSSNNKSNARELDTLR